LGPHRQAKSELNWQESAGKNGENCLAFQARQRDESDAPEGSQKGNADTMMNAETNDTAATVAAQGATVAPEKPSSKKTAKRTDAPKGEKAARGVKRPKRAKTGKKPAFRATGRTESKDARILEMIGRHSTFILDDPRLGWREFVQGEFTVRKAPGNATEIFNPPHVRELAAQLRALLDGVNAGRNSLPVAALTTEAGNEHAGHD